MGDANPSAWQLQEDGCLAATPLRSLTDSPLLMPARLCFAPPSLPESLGVAAGACAVRWPLGALAQSPAGCPPPFPRRYIRVIARPPARPVPSGAVQQFPLPLLPPPPVRAAQALSPSAPSPARGSGHAAPVAASGREGGGGGGSGSGSRSRPQRRPRGGSVSVSGAEGGGPGGAPRFIPRVPSAQAPLPSRWGLACL